MERSNNRILVAADDFLAGNVLGKEAIRMIQRCGETVFRNPESETEMTSLLRNVDAILLGGSRLGRKAILAANRLKIIARAGSGYENVDLETASKCGIVVTNVPAASTNAVAEHTILLILAVAKRLVMYNEIAREKNWSVVLDLKQSGVNVELYGKTLGIIGLGSIGSTVAQKARSGLAMNVLAFDHNPQKAKRLGFTPMALKKLLRESDVVSVHMPLTTETRGMIGKKELGLMKNTAILINTSRGGIVDEEALLKALREGRLLGAGLDVLSKEPPSPTNPLLRLDNIVLTPHVASHTSRVMQTTWFACVDAIKRVLSGSFPVFPANMLNRDIAMSVRETRGSGRFQNQRGTSTRPKTI